MGQVLELVLLGFGLNWCWQNRPQNSETQNRDQIYHMKVLEWPLELNALTAILRLAFNTLSSSSTS